MLNFLIFLLIMSIENYYFAIIIFKRRLSLNFFKSSLILKFAIQINKTSIYYGFDIEMIKSV
jgi:hypothetical protein